MVLLFFVVMVVFRVWKILLVFVDVVNFFFVVVFIIMYLVVFFVEFEFLFILNLVVVCRCFDMWRDFGNVRVKLGECEEEFMGVL